jgi:hypothetical protein
MRIRAANPEGQTPYGARVAHGSVECRRKIRREIFSCRGVEEGRVGTINVVCTHLTERKLTPNWCCGGHEKNTCEETGWTKAFEIYHADLA